MKYLIEITETRQKVVEVKAKSLNEAFNKLANEYDKGKLTLGASDFAGVSMQKYKEEK